MAKYKLEGLDEVLKMLKDVETLPQKCVNKSARNGAKIAHTDAKGHAPFLTGALEEGITLKAEKTKTKGKKVYQVTIKNNPEFVRTTSSGNRYYYPASQEFGFRLRDGGKVEGLHFLRNSIDKNNTRIESTMVQVLTAEIDKLR